MNQIILCDECKGIYDKDNLCNKCKFYITNYCDNCHQKSEEICNICKQARSFLERDDKRQASKQRKDRNYIIHIDITYAEDKKLIAKKFRDTAEQVIDNEDNKKIWQAFNSLTNIQRKRFIAYFIDKRTYRDIAQEDGVNHSKIQKSLEQTLKKLKKFLK